MLNFTEFTDELITGCKAAMITGQDMLTEIEKTTVNKPQKGTLTGLRFIREGSRIAPTLYAEDMYERYIRGSSVDRIARDVVESIKRSFDVKLPFSAEDLDPASMTEDIRPRLISKERNRIIAESVPHMDVGGGLMLIADIVRGEYRAMITNDMMKNSELAEEELFETALENIPQGEAVMYGLSDMLHAAPGDRTELLADGGSSHISDYDVYILSNKDMFWGAGALFYPGVMDKLSDLIGDFYVIPSSVHELLLLPVTADADPDNISEMIWSANRSVVDDEEVLSDDLFLVESGTFGLAFEPGVKACHRKSQEPGKNSVMS